MINELKESLWKQFGASIDMLGNAIALWPEEYWASRPRFFYIAYHCLVFLDYYLTMPPPVNFVSPLPFTLIEPENTVEGLVDDVRPDRIYNKKELLDYLAYGRRKCQDLVASLTPEKLEERWIETIDDPGAMNYSLLEILLYNLRHVQHHAAQLNLLLRQATDEAPQWVSRAKDDIRIS